jgi:hypothetical protein
MYIYVILFNKYAHLVQLHLKYVGNSFGPGLEYLRHFLMQVNKAQNSHTENVSSPCILLTVKTSSLVRKDLLNHQ